MVIFYVHLNLGYHTFIFKKKVALLHCYVYSHYRYQHTCDVIPPNAPSQDVKHSSVIILHMAHVFIPHAPGVSFKISVLRMPPIIRPVIIEYAQCAH